MVSGAVSKTEDSAAHIHESPHPGHLARAYELLFKVDVNSSASAERFEPSHRILRFVVALLLPSAAFRRLAR
jgi:hypothetical protein